MTQDNPNKQARHELRQLVISNRRAYNLETVVMADLQRKKIEKTDKPTWQR